MVWTSTGGQYPVGGGVNVGFLGSWGGSGPGGEGGGMIDAGRDRRPPHAPRELTVTLVGDFTIKCNWRDAGPYFGRSQGPPSEPIVHHWEMRVCKLEMGGTPQDGPQWRRDVLAQSQVVATAPSAGRGEMTALTCTDDTFFDIYVQIVAISNDNIVGVPSEPQPIYANGFLPTGPLDDVLSNVTITPSAFVDSNGSNWVDLNPTYYGPLTLGRFYGVSLHGVGYLGSTELQEFGNILSYTKSTGGKFRKFTMPRMASDQDAWTGAYGSGGSMSFTNGLTQVDKSTGANFPADPAWVGKTLYNTGLGSLGTVDSVSSALTLDLTAPFAGATDVYDVYVLNPVTFYFVSVDREGRRRVDPLSAPSVVVPQGIFAF